MAGKAEVREQVTCPYCGYRMPVWAGPGAKSRQIWVKCKNKTCRREFEIKR